MFHNMFAIAIAISPLVVPADMPPPVLTFPIQSGELSVDVMNPETRSVTIEGPEDLMHEIRNCTYRPEGGRSVYHFVIDWGDGTVFAITDGPIGESCADRAVHQYASPGIYTINVSIAATGANDEMVEIYEGKTSVSF